MPVHLSAKDDLKRWFVDISIDIVSTVCLSMKYESTSPKKKKKKKNIEMQSELKSVHGVEFKVQCGMQIERCLA